ncbi:MAG: RHS repeat protein [Phycisphaerae bacterium]|nr:RHS repeat protein [Phycisphaerae bacterium]
MESWEVVNRLDIVFIEKRNKTQTQSLYKSQSGNRIDYDAAGNLIADKDGYLYDYDGENRIVRISRGDGDSTPTIVAQFVYDALGRRIYAYDAIADAGRYFCYNTAFEKFDERLLSQMQKTITASRCWFGESVCSYAIFPLLQRTL